MSCTEEVVYQTVAPGEPEENGRCCLKGVGVDIMSEEAETSEAWVGASVGRPEVGSGVVGPLVAGGLEFDVGGKTRQIK